MSTPAAEAGYNAFVAQHVYLSPHLDDAVFSCGGLIARQTVAGESVTVLTVCAGNPPPGELSPFAQQLHARWNADRAPIEVRRSEDLAACERLCVGIIHLEIPDAIYRKALQGTPLYPDVASIFGALHEFETDLVDQLTGKLARHVPAGAVLYCPLGFGGHVDHRLTRRAAEGLKRALRYYADMPYAARGESIPDALGLPQGEKRVFKLEPGDIDAWVAASALYRSQISTFWADDNALSDELHAFQARENGLQLIVTRGQV